MIDKDIDVSVIVPIYNAEKYLNRCFESIKKQTYDSYEVLLINDGSTDLSEKICMEYEKSDRRVRYLKQENSGVAAARNRGILEAKGKYIAFLDNDDYLNKDFCLAVHKYMDTAPDVVFFQFKNVYDDADIQQGVEHFSLSGKEAIKNVSNEDEYLERELFCPTSEDMKKSTIVFPWGKAYRRSFMVENELFFDKEVKLCEDVYLNLKVYDKSKQVIYVKYPAYFYFHNIHSAGKGFNPNVVDIETKNISLLDQYVNKKERDTKYKKAYDNCLCFRYWSCCFSYFVHPQNEQPIKCIIQEMHKFEKETNIRRAFHSLPYLKKSMEFKEWIFLMCLKCHLYWLILPISRIKMKKSRG